MDFEDFCRREYEAVYTAAMAMTGHRELALDATQEAFGRALAHWRRLQKEPWAGGWVTTTALNMCRRALRREGLERMVAPSIHVPPASEPTAERIDVMRALADLPVRQRQVTILHYLCDLPIHAVAELTGLSDGTVKSYLARARDKLRHVLEELDQGSLEVPDA